jgi:hypothetical protein
VKRVLGMFEGKPKRIDVMHWQVPQTWVEYEIIL